jgi:hypothetical protein
MAKVVGAQTGVGELQHNICAIVMRGTAPPFRLLGRDDSHTVEHPAGISITQRLATTRKGLDSANPM